MSSFRPIVIVLVLALTVAGCGSDDDTASPQEGTMPAKTTETKKLDAMKKGAASSHRPTGEAGLRVPAKRAQIVAKDSEFGRILFDANGQVVYVFEIDSRNRSACTSAECVKAWPPVLTRDEHESPGEIKCHNVDLHGGLWWVVTPRGEPAS